MQVIKVGTSSLIRPELNCLNLTSIASIVETVRDLRNEGTWNYVYCCGPPTLLPHQHPLLFKLDPNTSRYVPKSYKLPVSMPHAGYNVVLVSSGAVGVGCQRMGLVNRPTELPKKQALAAVGQVHLMRYYDDLFSACGLVSQRRYANLSHLESSFFNMLLRLPGCCTCPLPRDASSPVRPRSDLIPPLFPFPFIADVFAGFVDPRESVQPGPACQRRQHLP